MLWYTGLAITPRGASLSIAAGLVRVPSIPLAESLIVTTMMIHLAVQGALSPREPTRSSRTNKGALLSPGLKRRNTPKSSGVFKRAGDGMD